MVVESIDWMFADGERLATCSHNHPFAVLGPQPLADGNWVVRAWLPDANQVWLLHQGQELEMECPHHPWLFEQVLPQEPGSGYRLRVHRAGITHEQHDPFAFREEWMGEMDRHLFSEGNHHHIWRRMGAHPTEQQGVAGVQFCVWAPSARSVALIGDCCGWDGRHLPMQQRLGAAGNYLCLELA